MDIRIVGQEDATQSPQTMESPESSPVRLGELEIHSIGQMFDLKPTQVGAFKEKIKLLLDYAKSQTDDHSLEGLKWAIRNLEYKVGTPPLGEKTINYLCTYAYLHLEGLRIEKEKEKYIKNSLK